MKNYITIITAIISTFPFLANGQNIKKKDTLKTEKLSEVIVIGKLRKVQKHVTLTAKEIFRTQSSSLGETLSSISGIQNVSFGPNVGLPMIRSLSGNRVKILLDDIAINDLSGITPNININIDQDKLLAINLTKGSGSVLFGGKAIGGAVNLKTNLIPSRILNKEIKSRFVVDYGYNSGRKSTFSVNGNLDKNFSWHFGGMYHYNKVIKIPGNTKPDIAYDKKFIGFDPTLQLLTQMNVSSEHKLNHTLFPYISKYAEKYMDIHELSYNDLFTFKKESVIDGITVNNEPNKLYIPGQHPTKDRYTPIIESIKDYVPVEEGVIPNSHSQGNSKEFGIKYTSEHFNIGAGYQHTNSEYGIPGYALSKIVSSHTHANGVVHQNKSIKFVPINSYSDNKMTRTQIDFLDVIPLISSIKYKSLSQYSIDKELLGSKTANQFISTRQSMRLELHQDRLSFLKGITGLDYEYRKIIGSGSQRYLPNNKSVEWSAFTLQKFNYKFLHTDIGYRCDNIRKRVLQDHTYKPGRGRGARANSDRNFKLNQFSANLKTNIFNISYILGSYNHSERAPEVNELYSGNRHFAILTEENGDDLMNKEETDTYELEVGIKWKGLNISFNYYDTLYKNYIYLADTGIGRNNFMVKEWRAADTKIYGFEGQISYGMYLTKKSKFNFTAYYDLVKNEDISGNMYRNHHEGKYMPNMPTSRYGMSFVGFWNKFNFNMNMDHYLQQKYLAKHTNPEHGFPSYTLLNSTIAYKLNFQDERNAEIYFYGKNILNKECRPHNSVLRYLAPLPGINIGVGLKLTI